MSIPSSIFPLTARAVALMAVLALPAAWLAATFPPVAACAAGASLLIYLGLRRRDAKGAVFGMVAAGALAGSLVALLPTEWLVGLEGAAFRAVAGAVVGGAAAFATLFLVILVLIGRAEREIAARGRRP